MKLKISTLLPILIVFLSISLNAAPRILEPDAKLGRTGKVLSNKIFLRLAASTPIASRYDIVKSLPGVTNAEQFLRNEESLTYNMLLFSAKSNAARQVNVSKILAAEEPLLRTFVIEFEGWSSPEYYSKMLESSYEDVEIATTYKVPTVQSLPNDEFLSKQMSMLISIRAPQAWEVYQGSSNVVIGISDNSVMGHHEDLKNNIKVNEGEIPGDGIDNDGNGYVDDYSAYNFAWNDDGGSNPGDASLVGKISHGTKAAGIAAASTDNELGIAGTGYKCKMFPMRCSIYGDQDMTYGYSSIKYAGIRGFDVLNCSWGGSDSYDAIRQSIIDFAVANDVAIVAAGGNLGDGSTQTSAFYPAAYRGVLGVGETDPKDRAEAGVWGIGTRILSPTNTYTTTDYSGSSPRYEMLKANGNAGSSFAAPAVAGAVGLARSLYPQLSAVQAIEFVRQMSDDIRKSNSGSIYLDLLPGRLNMEKIVVTDPFSIPAILPQKFIYTTALGTPTERYSLGDTVHLSLDVYNYLGAAENLTFTLEQAYDPSDALTMLETEHHIASIAASAGTTIGDFSFIVERDLFSPIILRVSITGEGDYKDFFKFEFTPVRDFNTFSNGNISFSVGDKGEFGSGTNSSSLETKGFSYGKYANQLWSAGLLYSGGENKVISYLNNEWNTVKAFISPNEMTGIVDDKFVGSLKFTGISVKQTYSFMNEVPSAVKLDLTLLNESGSVINDPSIGYLYDWDVSDGGHNDYENNRTYLLPEANPGAGENFAAMIAEKPDGMPYVGVGVLSSEPSAIAQAAGTNISLSKLTDANFYTFLNSGTEEQVEGITDIRMIMGMKFPNGIAIDDSAECRICIAAAITKINLAKNIRECLTHITGVSKNANDSDEYSLYPMPALSTLFVEGSTLSSNEAQFELYSLGGKLMPISWLVSDETAEIDLSSISRGVYVLKIIVGSEQSVRIIVKD